MPTIPPEVTLAGRGASGFGASRGRPGLMEMVQPKVVSEMPRGGPRRHHANAGDEVIDLFRATVRLRFARGIGERVTSAVSLAGTLLRLMRRS